MTKHEILESLEYTSDNFPRESLMAIRADRENYIPALLESLEYVCQNAEMLHDTDSDYFLHTYAMYMLAEFREKRAFPMLAALLRFPSDCIEFLLGDDLLEGFPKVLMSTFSEEHIQALKDVIEDTALHEWARAVAIMIYGLAYEEGHITKEEIIAYLRSLIYEKLPPDDSDVVFTGIGNCVIDAQLIELRRDIRYLHDNDRVDETVYGGYDGFIDELFDEKRVKESRFIEDAISHMGRWHGFADEDRAEKEAVDFEKMTEELAQLYARDTQDPQRFKNVGRNAPCPCGSGKKYKKCCYASYQSGSPPRLEDRFDLLKHYPTGSALFEETYGEDARSIDVDVYKALSHRAIPIWVKRDYEQERIGKIHYLTEALGLFLSKCGEEQITSFAEFDERYMVHYGSREWVSALVDLVEDEDAPEMQRTKKLAEETLRKWA